MPARPGAAGGQDRARHPADPSAAAARRVEPVLHRAATLGGRSALRSPLPRALAARAGRRERALRARLRRADRHAGLRPRAPAVGAYRRRRASPAAGRRMILKLHHSLSDGVGPGADDGRAGRADREPSHAGTAAGAARGARPDAGGACGRCARPRVAARPGPRAPRRARHCRAASELVGNPIGRGVRARRRWPARSDGCSARPPRRSARSCAAARSACASTPSPCPIDRLKAAAQRVHGKLNDAFVAGVAGGLRRYHEAHGMPVDALRMSMPINVRDGRHGHGRGQSVRARALRGAGRHRVAGGAHDGDP